jgi:hypothetical protein
MLKSAVFAAALLLMGTGAKAAVQGLYGSDCLHVEGLSAYKDLAFDEETLKQVQTVFGDQDCQTPAYDFIFEGPYSLDEKTGFLDYSFVSIKLTPLNSQVAENFNQHVLCGFDSWTSGESQKVAGLDCGGQMIPELGIPVYDRIQENQGDIQMGRATDELNGSSMEQRPDLLDAVIYHAK